MTLRENGSITCWDERAVTLEQPGPFARVDMGGRVCGLSADGNPTCFPPYASFPSGPFLQILSDVNNGGCGLRRTGELICLRDASSFFLDIAPKAALAQVRGGSEACGLRPDGRAIYWRSSTTAQLIDARRFIEVVPGFNLCCGVTADRRAWCTDNSYGLPAE